MKAEELMKWNWVFSKRFRRPVQIVTVASKVSYYVEGVLRTEKVGDVSPIPLSVEIMEKNGFKQAQKNYWCWERRVRTNTDIMYCDEIVGFGKEFPSKENGGLHTGGWIRASSAHGLVDIEGENVHQLQNALTFCGIEKEIVL